MKNMRLRHFVTFVFCLAASALFATAAAADRRVALVIGNAAYKSAPPLGNTINDSSAIANMFKSVGFETVISRSDLGVVEFKRAVREFLFTAENADIAVVYYAGHGVEIGGTNYLVPVDAKLSRDYDVEDEAVALDRIIWALQSVKRLRLILLDACRDNPFPSRLRSAGIRSTMKGGLGQLEDVSADTLVAYAAKAGSVSYDGDGPNSPYATALLRHLAEPGVDIRITLGRVRDDVINMSGGRQEPFIYGSLGGATIPLVPAALVKRTEPAPATAASTLGAAREPSPAPQANSSAASGAPKTPVVTVPPNPVRNPALAPPAAVAKAEPTAKPPVSEAVDPALACSRDEQRLARLRAEPQRDQIVKFQKELTCARLRAQVQRLLESVSGDASQPTGPVLGEPDKASPKQAQAQPRSPEESCAHDAARLAQLRAEPNADEIRTFERELSCAQIRPQLQRLRESLGP
jgi:uncharacterized caspase-like protein